MLSKSLFTTFGILTNCSLLILSGLSPNLNSSMALAETCIPLKVIGGTPNETVVRKLISAPGAEPLARNNWNTDFAVPTGRQFTRYVATVVPENNADYNIEVNLKYNDDKASQVYKKDGVTLKRNVPFRVTGSARATRQPYQVNVVVSGGLNNAYQARVSACQV